MLLQPGILALITGSGITLVLLSFAALLAVKILKSWDISSNSEEQLDLERKTYLISVLVKYGLMFEVISLFLFIYTADDIHSLLVGAMCATGSLNANPYGFPALYARIAVVFLSASWIAINHIDNKAEDYPLTRMKYMLLLFIIPFVFTGYFLQMKYFLRIDPNVITSCCGVLFSEGGTGAGSSLASLPLRETRAAFYVISSVMIISGFFAARYNRRPLNLFLSFVSVLFLVVSIASIISFISLYFYQLPSHHCPFDVLQSGYYYAGYPLYVSLFSAGFFGMIAGVVEPFRKISSLSEVIPKLQKRWALISACSALIFVIITLIPVVFLPFTLEGY